MIADIEYKDQDNVVMFIPRTEAGRVFMEKNIMKEHVQCIGNTFVVELHRAIDFVMEMQHAGLVLNGEDDQTYKVRLYVRPENVQGNYSKLDFPAMSRIHTKCLGCALKAVLRVFPFVSHVTYTHAFMESSDI